MTRPPKNYEREETITVTLPRLMGAFLRNVARQDKTSVSDVIGELVHNAMLGSFEEAKLMDAETGAPADMTRDQRDRQVLGQIGLERMGAMNAPEVKLARHALGLTQKQLAAKLKVDVMTISRWERGEVGVRPRHAFRLRTLVAKHAKGHQG